MSIKQVYSPHVIYGLLYTSVAHKPHSEGDLAVLLDAARQHNHEAGITGVLLYRHGRFAQLIEGRQDEVLKLFARIRVDTRHRNVVPLWIGLSSERSFSTWTMKYRDLAEDPLDHPHEWLLADHLSTSRLLSDDQSLREILALIA